MKSFLILQLILFISFSCSGQERTVGLCLNSESAFESYLLYAPTTFTTTYLLDNCGQVVQVWDSDYTPGLSCYLDSDGKLFRTGVLRNNNKFVSSGTGGVIQRFGIGGDVEWEVFFNNDSLGLHHDIHVMPNGHILALAWERFSRNEVISMGRDSIGLNDELWVDSVLEIEPIGTDSFRIVWEWHAIDHLVQDRIDTLSTFGSPFDFPQRINFNYSVSDKEDWLHMNSIFYDEARDEIILSVRDFSEVWIIDHSLSINEAKTELGDLLFRAGNPITYENIDASSFLYRQHDIEIEDEGRFSCFNNRNLGENSQVITFKPLIKDDSYVFEDGIFLLDDASFNVFEDTNSVFSSHILSSAQLLPNGNTFVNSGFKSRFVEYNSAGNIVWDYKGTVSLFGPIQQGSSLVGSAFKAIKYSVDDARFDNMNLEVITQQIETDPLPFDCEFYSSAEIVDATVPWDVYYSDGSLYLDVKESVILQLFDYQGRAVDVFYVDKHIDHLDLSNLIRGLYFVNMKSSTNSLSTKIFID